MTRTASRRLFPALACFAVAFGLYFLTLAPGVHWGDHAELQLAAGHPVPGVGVRSYPLWTGIAAVVVRGLSVEPAFGANLLSAFFGALAVALCFLHVQGSFGTTAGAVFAAFTLAVSHLLWSSSTVAEVYSLAACFLFLLLMAAEYSLRRIRRGAFLLGLIAGVSLLHHRMIQVAAVSMLPVLIVLWQRRETLVRGLVFGLLGTLAGAIPMAALFTLVCEPGKLGHQAGEFLLGGMGAHLPAGLGLGAGLLGLLLYGLSFLAFNLPGPQALGFLLALRPRLRPHPGHRSLLFAFLVGSLPALLLLPHVGDRYVLMLPAISAAAVLAGLAVSERATRKGLRILLPALALLCPPLFYGAMAMTDLPARLGFFTGVDPTHRQEFLWPGHARDRSAGEFASEVFDALPPHARVLTEWGDGCVLLYRHEIDGLRPDVTILQVLTQRRLEQALRSDPRGPVFLTTYPHTPRRLAAPPGSSLEERLPGKLWAIVPKEHR